MTRSRLTPFQLLFKWARARFNRIDQLLKDLEQAVRIFGEYLVSQIDDQNAAIAKLNQAVTDLQSRVANQPAAPDLTANTAAINAAADALNAVLPAAPTA